ncbi:hypothetical protein H310_01479 [Aphanomyces invadans]|uniref:NADPH-dependent FMN and FAD-containing oxidoreductase n=1 Tax=Aphanomyces invadans TaxID=157072 RepID=A0A024UTP8_9STRA|nr:hypothetical protein H310_01479 [Aphanomyces invadans]ETW09008.1 hypothetical protein H310_01479 [Aphanomyces invadans]|eukprot:XP_008862813.1 hypothetical protein H310_01479 [Aphanomyces invadans]
MLHVLYGSATGTGQDVAEQIGRMATARHIPVIVSSMDAFDIHQLPALSHVVFVASSTGDGEAPENMTSTWKFLLRKSLAADSLQAMKMAVFGLGDSSYAKYNAVARRLHARLLQLGAVDIIGRGLGDDQHELGYHGALNPWLDKLWSALLQMEPFILPPGFVVDDSPKPTPPKYVVQIVTDGAALTNVPDTRHTFYDQPKTALDGSHLIQATLTKNERLTAADWTQDVRHIELALPASSPTYSAGDIALLYPENVQTEAIDSFLNMTLQLPPSTQLFIRRIDGKPSGLPSRCTAEELMRQYLDVFGTPRRSFFERLSLFTQDPDEKEKLMELSAPEGADLLQDYCARERRTYIEVLQDFSTCHVPLEFLVELIPCLAPRAYSIASSPNVHPRQVHLTVAIVDYLTPYKRHKKGVCSAWLEKLEAGATVPMRIKTGLFRLTSAIHSQNVILIGPGTGIAVMRAIAQERQAQRTHGTSVGDTHVYFGCRHRDKDFLYGDEWAQFAESGGITSFNVAFSRDQEDKVYVQAKLAEQKAAVFAVLSQGGYCFIAGSAKRMPSDVYSIIRDIIVSEGRVSGKEADAMMKSLVRQKRYIVGSWS